MNRHEYTQKDEIHCTVTIDEREKADLVEKPVVVIDWPMKEQFESAGERRVNGLAKIYEMQ